VRHDSSTLVELARLLGPLRALSGRGAALGRRRRQARRWRRVRIGAIALLMALPLPVLLLWSLQGLWQTRGAAAEPAPGVRVALPIESPAEAPTEPVSPTPQRPPHPLSAETPLPLAAPPLLPLPALPRPERLDLAEIEQAFAGSGGSGDAGTTFFGIASAARRIAYILDVSASMESGGRLWLALDELKRSLAALPDHTFFAVVLFSSRVELPPFAPGWQRATPANLRRMLHWLDHEVATSGGTRPAGAFEVVFALSPPVQAVYFLTDGEIPAETPALVRRLVSDSRISGGAVVHTIGIGEEIGRAPLEQIAAESGGVFRFIPTGGVRR